MEPTISSFLGSDSGVCNYGDLGIAATKLVNKIKLNVSNVMHHSYLDALYKSTFTLLYFTLDQAYHTSVPYIFW